VDAHDHHQDGAGHVTFTDVFRVGEYRALWSAQLLSLIGDQLAVVAITWLVFDRSRSPLFASIAYAISFLPWLIGGPLLSGLADRMPRREVMVVCDVVRAVLMVVMATAGLPLWVLCVLLFAGELLAPPFGAARAAVLPDVLEGDRYVVGTAIGTITNQLGQVLGFGVGGLIVTFLSPSLALGVNALTFAVSAVLLAAGLRRRPAARSEDVPQHPLLSDALGGMRLVFGRRDLRAITGLALVCVFFIVPEGLAAPYAAGFGGGATATGLLLAAIPAGSVAGTAVLGRWVSPARRFSAMGVLAIASCAPLMLCGLRPGLVWSLVILVVSGFATAYQLPANAAFVLAVPAQARGQAFGLIQALLNVGQGSAIVLAGALAERWEPTWVVSGAGAIGTVAALVVARAWRTCIRARAVPRVSAVDPTAGPVPGAA
jgi:MFS family permease